MFSVHGPYKVVIRRVWQNSSSSSSKRQEYSSKRQNTVSKPEDCKKSACEELTCDSKTLCVL
jgi:hypothetical protein